MAEQSAPIGFDDPDRDVPAPGEGLVVEVEGFEGPLDLLLMLARTQKVDLAKISILALAEQYLGFVEEARKVRLELAADYLVMAAWLAFLKSRLLLPKQEIAPEEVSGEELAAMLAFRLQRLEAMRAAVASLMKRPRLDIEVAARGAPEGIRLVRSSTYTATVYDLLKAYTDQRRKTMRGTVTIKKRYVWSVKEARNRLEQLLGKLGPRTDWVVLDRYLERFLAVEADRRTALASSFGALLELAREGYIDLRQDRPFAPIFVQASGRAEA